MAKRTAKVDLSKVDREELNKVLKEREHKLISINDITPNPWNKNKMGAQYFAALKANIANPKVGFTIPVLLRPNPDPDATIPYMIIDGEHRYKAAKDIGYTEIPAIIFKQMPDSLAKYLMIESNAVHGDTSDADIKAVLSEIENDDFLEEFDIWAATITEEPLEDTSKYAMDDDDLDDLDKDTTVPVTLYFSRTDQIDIFRRTIGQIRLSEGCTQEQAVMAVINHFNETTGFGGPTGDDGLDAKQSDLISPKKK